MFLESFVCIRKSAEEFQVCRKIPSSIKLANLFVANSTRCWSVVNDYTTEKNRVRGAWHCKWVIECNLLFIVAVCYSILQAFLYLFSATFETIFPPPVTVNLILGRNLISHFSLHFIISHPPQHTFSNILNQVESDIFFAYITLF